MGPYTRRASGHEESMFVRGVRSSSAKGFATISSEAETSSDTNPVIKKFMCECQEWTSN